MPQPESTPLPKLPVIEMAPFEYRIIPAPHFCPVLVLRQPPDNPGSLSVPWVKMFLAPTWVVCFLSQFGFFVLENLAADWLALDWLKLTHILWVLRENFLVLRGLLLMGCWLWLAAFY